MERESFKHKNGFIILEDVTVGVCDHCGNRYYSAELLHAVACYWEENARKDRGGPRCSSYGDLNGARAPVTRRACASTTWKDSPGSARWDGRRLFQVGHGTMVEWSWAPLRRLIVGRVSDTSVWCGSGLARPTPGVDRLRRLAPPARPVRGRK
ncbi:MAG: YgiT-type zinc finger protein [Pseudomonadota bacterium]|nr:YgiT-type zinc finger protein [Pseudomonadota bacterium]